MTVVTSGTSAHATGESVSNEKIPHNSISQYLPLHTKDTRGESHPKTFTCT